MTSLLQSFNTQEMGNLIRQSALGRDFTIGDEFFKRKLGEFCKTPVTGELTYIEDGKTINKVVGDINQSFPYFNLLRNKNRIPTLFIHSIEKIEKTLSETIYNMSPEHHWRFSNVSSSISAKDSSIGFHADTMDVIVVQIYGARFWQLYREENMVQSYTRALQKNIIIPAPVHEQNPDATYDLVPGDILHIPAYWGHSGVTSSDETSFSLSFSWYHFTPYIFLIPIFDEHKEWETLLDSPALYASYNPPYLDQEELANYLLQLFEEKNITVQRDEIVKSIETVLTGLTSTNQKKVEI